MRSNCGPANALPSAVLGVVQKRTDVVDEERVQAFGNLLLVCKIQSTVVRNPDTFEVHGTNLDDMAGLFALQNTVSPTSRHTSYIQQLRAVDHVIVFSASDTHAVRLDLKAQTTLVFPQSSGDSGLHARGSDLTGSVNDAMFVVHTSGSRQIVCERCVR